MTGEKMRKKILPVLSVLLIAVLVISVYAADITMTLSADKTTAYRGDSVVVTVTISEMADCKSGGIRITYDESVFERADEEWLLTGTMMAEATGDAVFSYSNAKTISGGIYRFALKVKSGAAFGSYDVKLSLTLRDSTGASTKLEQTVRVTVGCSHSYGAWTKVDGTNHSRTCSDCSTTEVKAHTWNSGEVTKSASCKETGVKTYTCTDCGATKTETIAKADHTYSNSCDTDCNICGATRTITHSYSTKWSSDGSKHWHACTVCGAKTDEAAHTPGAAATEWTAQTCTSCGYVIKSALGHTHKYAAAWSTDVNGHWHECSGCEDIADYEDHVFDDDCDTECNTCGYTRTITHVYMDRWNYDGTGHWHECSICGEVLEKTPHVTDSQDDEQRCTVCGYLEPAEDHTHKFEGDWFRNETEHWQQCACGVLSEVEAHTWDDGVEDAVAGKTVYTCTVCGAEKTESGSASDETLSGDSETQGPGNDPAKEKPEEDFQFPWWMLIVAVAVLIVGFGVYLIVGIFVGKKQTGKFSAK